jgi:hypothetical protein
VKAEDIVRRLLENEEPSPEELIQHVDPLDLIFSTDPNKHVPCGKYCYRCGAPCTLIHRQSDRPAPYHICQRCDMDTI